MANIDDARQRATLLSKFIQQRADTSLRKTIDNYIFPLKFTPLKHFMISRAAWNHIATLQVPPKFIFAHPDILKEHPEVSQYYRGMAFLSQKQVGQLTVQVASWEEGSRKQPVQPESCLKVARLYNSVISSIIVDSANWTLENGYRNIIATMGIRLDGMFRNKIGQMAEDLIKRRIADWAESKGLVLSKTHQGVFMLSEQTVMRYGSDPDIEFERKGTIIATVEIKGGKDPAGALERLGAMIKSFAKTPPGCVNFLVAGVVTPEMKTRLMKIGVVKVFLLDDLSTDDRRWDQFVTELFHHTIRLI